MVAVEILLALVGLLIAWLSLTSTAQEDASTYEQRIRNVFVSPSDRVKTYTNNRDDRIGVTVQNVIFEETKSWPYFFKRAFWPWQGVEGKAKFSVRTKGMVIDDMDDFRNSMPDWGTIAPCTNDAHDNHYYVDLDNTQPDIREAFEREGIYGYQVFFHYFANSAQVTYLVEE